jgi:lauroyl/myristoyl acyltransferase
MTADHAEAARRMRDNLMRDELYRSLCEFLDTEARRGARDWFIGWIRRWSAEPSWIKSVGRLGTARQVERLAQLGRRVCDSDLAGWRTFLEDNTRSLAEFSDPDTRRRFLRQHTAFLFISLLDHHVLADDGTRAAAMDRFELCGGAHAEAAIRAGRGLIVLGCHQSHSAFGFRSPPFARRKFLVVRDPSADFGFPSDWAARAYGDSVEFATTSPAGLEKLVDCLASGGCVALHNDFSFPQTLGLPGSLFLRPVFVSRALVRLILRTKAAVLPTSIVRLEPFSDRRIRLEFHPPLQLDALTESKRDQTVAAVCLSAATECLIRRYPVQWTHWSALQYRWNEAKDAWSAIDRLMQRRTAPCAPDLASATCRSIVEADT